MCTQNGQVLRNRISNTYDWCIYTKGMATFMRPVSVAVMPPSNEKHIKRSLANARTHRGRTNLHPLLHNSTDTHENLISESNPMGPPTNFETKRPPSPPPTPRRFDQLPHCGERALQLLDWRFPSRARLWAAVPRSALAPLRGLLHSLCQQYHPRHLGPGDGYVFESVRSMRASIGIGAARGDNLIQVHDAMYSVGHRSCASSSCT